MKKFVRGKFGRSLSLLLMILFLLPSLLGPLASRGNAATGGHINILFIPLTTTDADAPADLGARILQELQISLSQQEGVQVAELNKKSSLLKRAIEQAGDEDKGLIADKFNEVASVDANDVARKDAAGYLARMLSVDAIVYGKIDKYEFSTKPDKNQSFIRITATKVTVADDGTALMTPLIVIGRSNQRADGGGSQISHDAEAIISISQNLATQLTGRGVKTPDRRNGRTVNVDSTDPIGGVVTTKEHKQSRMGIVLLVLGGVALAALAGGGGGGSHGTNPPPVVLNGAWAYPSSSTGLSRNRIRIEFPKPANWANVKSFEIDRQDMSSAMTMTRRGKGSRATGVFSPVSIVLRDNAILQGNTVVVEDQPSTGFVYRYRIQIILNDNTKTALTVYNGQAPSLQLDGVGAQVPPPIVQLVAPISGISGGKATLSWSMPGEPAMPYQLPTSSTTSISLGQSYVSGFVVQRLDSGNTWTTVVSGIPVGARTVQVPIPQADTTYTFTVRAISTSGYMYPLDVLSSVAGVQYTADVISSTAYAPMAPTGVSVVPLVDANPDIIDERVTWTPSTDTLVSGYNIFRTEDLGSGSSAAMSRAATRSSTRNRLVATRTTGSRAASLPYDTVTGRLTNSWIDLNVDPTKTYIYSVQAVANGSISGMVSNKFTPDVTPIPPTPTLLTIADPNSPKGSDFQVQWQTPDDPAVYGYVVLRSTTAQSRATKGIISNHGKLGMTVGRRGSGRSSRISLRPGLARIDASYQVVMTINGRMTTYYTDTDMQDGVTFSYAIEYLYLGNIAGTPSDPCFGTFSVLPGDVTGLQLTQQSSTSIQLSWTPPTVKADGSSPMGSDGDHFLVYRSTTMASSTATNLSITSQELAQSFQQFGNAVAWNATQPQFTDNAVPQRKNVSYAVVAVDKGSQSSPGPYLVKQVIMLPPAKSITLAPKAQNATVGDPPYAFTATVIGTDDKPLPQTAVSLSIAPATAGGLGTVNSTAANFATTLGIVTNDLGVATFYWKPPTAKISPDSGTITATVIGTALTDTATVTIQPAQPPNYVAATGLAISYGVGQPTRLYFSNDADDKLSNNSVTKTVITVTGTAAGGGVAPYARIKLTTDRGGFERMTVDQIVSSDRKSIIGVLDNNGQMNCRYTGRVDDGIAKGAISLPISDELGTPIILGQDTYQTLTPQPVGGTLPTLVGPPYRIKVSLTTVSPATPAGWPAQTDLWPVIFQNQTQTIEAVTTDLIGQRCMREMPIWFTQTWSVFDANLSPYDYVGANGHANVAGQTGSTVGLTDDNGVANGGISSNHSGLYTVKAIALLRQYDIDALNAYNLNTSGGLPDNLPADDPTWNYLLWNSGAATKASTDTAIIGSSQLLNKTLVFYDHWTVLQVSDGINTSTTFARLPSERPPILINCDGTQTARITFTATDEDNKNVLPGVPFRIFSELGQCIEGASLEQPNGLLQLDGDLPNVNRAGTYLTFNDRSQASVLSRGDQEAPMIGTIRLKFDNLRSVQPLFEYPGYLVGHRGPSIWLVTPGSVTGGGRIASSEADGAAGLPKAATFTATLLDNDLNPFPGNYYLGIYGMTGGGGYLDGKGTGTFNVGTSLIPPGTGTSGTPGYDELHNVLPRPPMTDVVDTSDIMGVFDPTDPNRNARVVLYGNPWEPSREDWPIPTQQVTVERPHRLQNFSLSSNNQLPIKINLVTSVEAMNNLHLKGPVLAGFNIRFGLIWSNGAHDSTIDSPAVTDNLGYATTLLHTGSVPDVLTVYAWYDTNLDGLYTGDFTPTGYEPFIQATNIYIGMMDPTGLTSTLVTNRQIQLQWNAVPGADHYELVYGGNTYTVFGTTYTAANLTGNTSYTFSLTAVDATGLIKSKPLNYTIKTLADLVTPAGLTVTAFTNTSVSLGWTASVGADHYLVTVTGTGAGTGTFTANGINLTVPGLTPATSYGFTVTAVDATGLVTSPPTPILNQITLP